MGWKIKTPHDEASDLFVQHAKGVRDILDAVEGVRDVLDTVEVSVDVLSKT